MMYSPSPGVLLPFDRREAISLKQAAEIAARGETTVRTWCKDHGIGRRIGGRWAVSNVALAMFLDGQEDALSAYLTIGRDHPLVALYLARFGLLAA